MFKAKSLVLDFFVLVLKVALELALDTCYKDPKITQILAKGELKLFPSYGDIFALIKLMVMLILGLSKANAFVEEKDFKQSAVSPIGLSGIEIVFALLVKIVTVYE